MIVQNVDFYGDAPSFVRELERVWQKVEEYLKVPPFIANYRLYQIEMDSIVDHCLELNPIGSGHELKHLQRLENGGLKIKVLVCDTKLIVLKLGKVQ